MDVVERWPGSVYDSTIFDNSQVRETLLTSSSGWLRLLWQWLWAQTERAYSSRQWHYWRTETVQCHQCLSQKLRRAGKWHSKAPIPGTAQWAHDAVQVPQAQSAAPTTDVHTAYTWEGRNSCNFKVFDKVWFVANRHCTEAPIVTVERLCTAYQLKYYTYECEKRLYLGVGNDGPGKNGPVKRVQVKMVLGKIGPGK